MAKKVKTQKVALTPAQFATELKLTEADLQSIGRAALATWQTIGYDILQAHGGKSIPRDEVMECVMDADYLLMYHGRSLTDAARLWMKKHEWQPYQVMLAYLAQYHFTFTRYGL